MRLQLSNGDQLRLERRRGPRHGARGPCCGVEMLCFGCVSGVALDFNASASASLPSKDCMRYSAASPKGHDFEFVSSKRYKYERCNAWLRDSSANIW